MTGRIRPKTFGRGQETCRGRGSNTPRALSYDDATIQGIVKPLNVIKDIEVTLKTPGSGLTEGDTDQGYWNGGSFYFYHYDVEALYNLKLVFADGSKEEVDFDDGRINTRLIDSETWSVGGSKNLFEISVTQGPTFTKTINVPVIATNRYKTTFGPLKEGSNITPNKDNNIATFTPNQSGYYEFYCYGDAPDGGIYRKDDPNFVYGSYDEYDADDPYFLLSGRLEKGKTYYVRVIACDNISVIRTKGLESIRLNPGKGMTALEEGNLTQGAWSQHMDSTGKITLYFRFRDDAYTLLYDSITLNYENGDSVTEAINYYYDSKVFYDYDSINQKVTATSRLDPTVKSIMNVPVKKLSAAQGLAKDKTVNVNIGEKSTALTSFTPTESGEYHITSAASNKLDKLEVFFNDDTNSNAAMSISFDANNNFTIDAYLAAGKTYKLYTIANKAVTVPVKTQRVGNLPGVQTPSEGTPVTPGNNSDSKPGTSGTGNQDIHPIVPAPAPVTPPKKMKAPAASSTAKKTIQVTFTPAAGAKGYEIQYSTDKKFKKDVKTKTVKKGTAKSAKIKKLTSGKKYYVRIRAYKVVDGQKVYAKSWSKKKAIMVK